MLKNILMGVALTAMAAPAFAEGDAAKGEESFNKQCVACHIVADADGKVLAGRNSKVGPNLYGVIGRAPGSIDYKYGKSIVELGEAGAVWDQESFVAYVQDPTGYLREALDNRRARGKMAYKVKKEEDAQDLYAFLATFSE
jgi:Cytochrome c2